MRKLPYVITLTKSSGETREFLLREAAHDDLPEIIRLKDVILQTISNRDHFRDTAEEEFKESLREDLCFCAECEGSIIGITLMVAPRISYRNLGNYLDYDEEKLLKCASMDMSFIIPEYRGYGLQKHFFEMRTEAAIELGATEALTTIAPGNQYSLNNALAHGFEVIRRQVIYDGLDRYILRKSLSDEKDIH